MRSRIILATLAVIALFVAVGVYFWTRPFTPKLPPHTHSEYCVVEGNGEVTLSLDQMSNAATISAVGIRRGVPDQAIAIALATSLQESKLENLSGGDRDSVGLFQQRPSQGWGTPKQISDPVYAAGRFYSALLKVHGWQKMTVTEAAQAVQRSGHPDAYQKWATEASVLSSALLGDVSHAVSCMVGEVPSTRGAAAMVTLGNALTDDWGSRPDRVKTTGPDELALFVANAKAGWQYAHWLVAHAQDSGIMMVRFGNQQWTAKAGTWAAMAAPTRTVEPAVAGGETVLAQVFSATT